VLTCSEFFSPLSLFVQFLFFQIFETRISFGRISRLKLSGRHDGDGDTFKAQNSKRNSGFSFFFFLSKSKSKPRGNGKTQWLLFCAELPMKTFARAHSRIGKQDLFHSGFMTPAKLTSNLL